jgi:hypothetical protein
MEIYTFAGTFSSCELILLPARTFLSTSTDYTASADYIVYCTVLVRVMPHFA